MSLSHWAIVLLRWAACFAALAWFGAGLLVFLVAIADKTAKYEERYLWANLGLLAMAGAGICLLLLAVACP